MSLEPRIVWEDEHLAVVDKPAGLIVHPAPGNPGPSLVEALGDLPGGGDDPQRPGIVHRLDKDTSGLLIVARSPEAHRALSAMIAAREVSRPTRLWSTVVRPHGPARSTRRWAATTGRRRSSSSAGAARGRQ